MTARAAFVVACALILNGCSGRTRPTGPPPEFEPPRVRAWDAGRAVDPLEAAEQSGEWVDEEGTDGGAPKSGRGARDAGKDVG
jgi:hypothetical protein